MKMEIYKLLIKSISLMILDPFSTACSVYMYVRWLMIVLFKSILDGWIQLRKIIKGNDVWCIGN